ncbi:MAG: DUF2671 domain-containing protein [Rickettsiales bacterium]
MTYKNKMFLSLNVTRDAKSSAAGGEEGQLADLMASPEYLRHSSTIINEALKEGFDVLQLPNGDIVTTGTRIVTNTYVWDAAKGKLHKARTAGEKSPTRKTREKIHDDEDAE